MELAVTIGMLIIVAVAVIRVHQANVSSWNKGYARAVIRTRLLQALESVEKKLLHARSVDDITQSSITFTADLGEGDHIYRLYLYNENDPEPNPPYSQGSYAIRFARDDVDYGDGVILASDIARPSTPAFSIDDKVVSIQFSASREGQSVTMSTKIRPRNM